MSCWSWRRWKALSGATEAPRRQPGSTIAKTRAEPGKSDRFGPLGRRRGRVTWRRSPAVPIGSLEPGSESPRDLAQACRGYWSVENKNHWKRDAVWSEDRSRVRDPNIAQALTLIRCALLGPLARSGFQSLPAALETLARDQSQALALIRNQRLA